MYVRERVEKLGLISDEKKVMKDKSFDESLVVFHLKNQSKVAYLVDMLTLKEVRNRLKGGLIGIIKIGDNRTNRLELNAVQDVYINDQPFKA